MGDPTQRNPGTKTLEGPGCALGCILAILLYVFPFPVAVIVWWFDLKGPFGDYMLMVLPLLLLLPFVCAILGRGIRAK